jgi:NitT/TauT family transport system substrate-binding protein
MRCLVNKIFLVLLTIFVFQVSAHAADKIRIGYPAPLGHFITLPLAQKKGFFREEGIEAEMILLRGPATQAAFLNGEIDYFPGIGAMVSAAVAGVPVKVVACYVPAFPIMLIARSEFKSVQELKSKTIMVGNIGAGPYVIARMILKHFGLDPDKDVKFIPGPSSEARLAVLNQGLVAATVATPPFDFHGKKLGLNVLARSHELFSYPEAGLITTVKKMKERPDEIKRVIKAGIRANRYIRTEREGTIQFLIEWQKVNKEIAAATYESVWKAYNDDGTVPEDALRLVIEEAKRATKVNRQVSVSDVADLSILKEAQRELGIKGK